MNTPGRASFAGVASQAKQSPSFRDIARLIVPTNREKAFKQAMTNAVAMLIVVFILVTLYAVNVVLTPFLRPLLLALLFGSFLHPMKQSLSLFFKRILKEIREDEVPILAGFVLPFSIIDKFMERLRTMFCEYVYRVVKFGRTILSGDFRSALAVCLAAMSLVIIGGDSLMNFVMCINLIIFVADITKTDFSFSDAYLHFLIRSFGLAQFCWLHKQIIYLLLPIILLWMGLSWLISKLIQKFLQISQLEDENIEENGEFDDELDLDSGRPREELKTPRRNLNTTRRYNDQDLPPNLKSIYDSLKRLYGIFIDQLDDYIDTISSACVISIVAFIVIFTALYLSVQIYTESVYLIEKISVSLNAILNNNPDLKSLLPDGITGVNSLLDGAVKNTYQHGREWIRKSTRQLLNNASMEGLNTTQSSMIEKQMVEFWDRAYALWLNNRANGTTTILDANLNGKHQPYDWDRLFVALQSLDLPLCWQIFKQNWDTLVSVMDSVMIVLKGNLSLVLGMVTATVSLVIFGGNVLLNFIIDLIIFTTALFYLLCASEEQYKPIELVKSLIPRSEPSPLMKAKGQTNRNDFINSVDESINGVFTASLKMMAFHGLSTWLLHRLFELEVVYIPSVISALFGAVPFISPYWASVPACFDLWLSGHVSQAVLMLLLATIPSSFVTTAFYSEIKGAGHPYLTGLAIAGGVFVFGIEGALFGPMLLVSIRLLSLIVVYYMDAYK